MADIIVVIELLKTFLVKFLHLNVRTVGSILSTLCLG